MLVAVWHILHQRVPYQELGASHFDQLQTQRLTRHYLRRLEELGVKPADITFVAVSHTHPDHIGNVELFPQAMLLVQKAEYEWPGASGSDSPGRPRGGPQSQPAPEAAGARLSKRVATGFPGALKTDVESRTPAARTQ